MSADPPARALPRGPHSLSREDVERSQRDRLIGAMMDAVAELGFAKTSVADVLSRAGVSRATFYQQFKDKDDCFLAAYAATSRLVADVMAQELDRLRASDEPDPLVRLDGILAIYLTALQAAPALARTFLIEVYAAGPQAIEQRLASLEHFTDIVCETHRGEQGLLGTEPRQRFAAEVLVGAVISLVTNLVGTGRADDLPTLREPLIGLARQMASTPL